MTELRRRMLEDMQLRGLAKNTQQSYMDCVKALAKHYNRRPDQLSEDEIRNFFLYLTYATHLLESGVNIRVIQGILVHRNPKSTMIYTHLTQKIVKKVQSTVDNLMSDL